MDGHKNVDFTQDENTILWSSFLKDSRYSSEVSTFMKEAVPT